MMGGHPRDRVIEKWKTIESEDFRYFDVVEEQTKVFWDDEGVFKSLFNRLDLSCILELACGKGRHSAQIVNRCGELHLADTSPDALSAARRRFAGADHVHVHLIPDGESLPFLSDASMTSAFSYDAMVHFEPTTIAAYMRELSRVLAPGGLALLHHSNFSGMPDKPFDLAPGWRNYMTTDLFRHFAHRAGLGIEEHHQIDWAAPKSDALSLLKKAD